MCFIIYRICKEGERYSRSFIIILGTASRLQARSWHVGMTTIYNNVITLVNDYNTLSNDELCHLSLWWIVSLTHIIPMQCIHVLDMSVCLVSEMEWFICLTIYPAFSLTVSHNLSYLPLTYYEFHYHLIIDNLQWLIHVIPFLWPLPIMSEHSPANHHCRLLTWYIMYSYEHYGTTLNSHYYKIQEFIKPFIIY